MKEAGESFQIFDAGLVRTGFPARDRIRGDFNTVRECLLRETFPLLVRRS